MPLGGYYQGLSASRDRGEIMVPDWETNLVYFSRLLARRYPASCSRAKRLIEGHGFPVRFLQGTADIWIRDYAPVQISRRRFVKFRYAPDYLRGYEHLVTNDEICGQLQGLGKINSSDLVVDGGNIVAARTKVILTEKVFRENPKWKRTEVRKHFQETFHNRTCIIIPMEPLDPIGHSDGLVRFLDDNRVVVNDYSKVDPRYGCKLERALAKHGLEINRLPYRPDKRSRRRVPPATGNYVNFLRVGNLVVVPAHGLPEDDEAVRVLRGLLPKATVVPLDCRELAREGGCWNCVSWTVKV